MQNLPTAEVYEKEFKYMPWGVLIDQLLERVKDLPPNAKVLDILCGPGYLLSRIKNIRPDLELTGVDLEPEFIEFAKRQYPTINFVTADARTWMSDGRYDFIFVTGGVHHLPYEDQEAFIKRVSTLLKTEGQAIIADPYIDDYANENERKRASAKLGYEYLLASMANGADKDIIKACMGIMENDVLGVEYKNSIQKFRPTLEKYFSNIEMHKTWPSEESGYGDYYFVLGSAK